MPLYRCVYENDIEADSPREAAKQCYEIMRDPESMPPIIDVCTLSEDEASNPGFTCDRKEFTSIDLNEELKQFCVEYRHKTDDTLRRRTEIIEAVDELSGTVEFKKTWPHRIFIRIEEVVE
jgi:hypothetical protein